MNTEQQVKEFFQFTVNKTFNDLFFYTDERKLRFITNILKSTQRHYLSFEGILASVENPSRNSSDGCIYEKIISDFAILNGWENELNKDIFKQVKQKKKLSLMVPADKIKKIEDLITSVMDAIKNIKDDKQREKEINKIKNNLIKVCIDDKYIKENKKFEQNFDFCMIAPTWVEPTKTIIIKELKLGGDMDSKKTTEERRALLRQFALLHILYANEIKAKRLTVKCEIAIINEETANASVKRSFTNNEIICGRNFWINICGHDLLDFSKKTISEYRENEQKDPRTKAFYNEIKTKIKLEFARKGTKFYSTTDVINMQKETIEIQKEIIERQNELTQKIYSKLTKEQLETA
jgi:hypothetical protein